MKDVYDHLNDIDMDVSQFEEGEVSEVEKSKVKMDLKRKISKPKPVRWRKIAAAASISIGLSSAALFGLSFTSFAQEIPIIGQVFKWFNDDGFFENYSEHANMLSMTQEDNGISITLNEAVFDGKTLYVTYELTSEIDLGDDPALKGIPSILNHDGGRMASGSSNDLKKVDDFRYVGVSTAIMYPENRVEEGSFEFDITGIILDSSNVDISGIITDTTYSMKEIAGNWKFQFDLQATDNAEQSVGLSSAENDVTVSVNKVVYTPMSFILFYENIITQELFAKWDFISVDMVVEDDLGHTYAAGGYSGRGPILRSSYTQTFEKLDPKAKKLIVTPTVVLSQRDGTYENGAYYRNENSTAPMETFKLDEIVIELEK
jgi:hypothetical protein